ncbi:sodium/glutamate symporter [Sandaracinobacter sp. RS1-74]|uniref:sodium/glutamate symporter n=1 Tax=Sandaracinobacteroides sayramensis TaxID=2913411 RepID=UPI001EDA604A|nr:sodium/glutamate symporter [Sandaracinobacteroides sayramensis]MCG2842034.1 sodium/glutamate symporter [Sandaracinobacteroides sayramensis]
MTAIDGFLSFTLAVMLLLVGKVVTLRCQFLRRYSIPEPAIGGLFCAVVTGLAYFLFDHRVEFDLQMRDFLLLLFFAGVGLKCDVATLLDGGRPLLTLIALATVFMAAQNMVGQGVAALFGMDPLTGLMAGSISLTGGVGTTMAWAPIFEEKLEIADAGDLGLASNMIGLIAACAIGGPVAAFLIRRHRIEPAVPAGLLVGTLHDAPPPPLDYFALLWAMFVLNVTIMLGMGLHALISGTGVTLPEFVSCLVAGIVVRNMAMPLVGARVRALWPAASEGLSLLLDIALGLFLTMALMGLRLSTLEDFLGFVTVVMLLQIAMSVAYAVFVVFPAMGRDYEAAVVSAAFGGITLGSTATAVANMTAVAQQHGGAPRAFLIVPLVCGFFIDIVNAMMVSAFIG